MVRDVSTESLDRELRIRRERALIEEAFKKAEQLLQEERRIDPNVFTHFDPAMVAADQQFVRTQETKFAQQGTEEEAEARKLGLILEAIIHEQVELNNWIGEKVTTVKASKFDDFVNGIDIIAEYDREMGVAYLALAIDVTHGDPSQKLNRIRSEIDNEQLTEVKYFISSDETIQGTLKKVPRVIVGADREAVVKLAELWIKNKKTEMARHPIQLQLLEEISLQLRAFIQYAEAKGRSNIADIYRKQLRLIELVQQDPSKLSMGQQDGAKAYQTQDRVFARLKQALERF